MCNCRSLLLLVFSLFPLVALDAAAESKQPIAIGVITPLSGGFADWGATIRRGIELYDALNPGRYKFDFQDEVQGDAKKALAAYQKFRADGVHYVIVSTMVGTKALLPVAAKDPVLLLSIGLVDDYELSHSDKLLSLATQLGTESEYLGGYVTRTGSKRVAIVNRNDPFSEEFGRTLARALEKGGAVVVTHQGVDPGEADFRGVLLRVKSSNPDAICFNVAQDREAVFVKQAKELGIRAALFSNYDFEASEALSHGGLLSAVRYSFPINSADNTKAKDDFDRAFAEKFGPDQKPGANSYFIYDGLTLLTRAVAGCDAADVACVNGHFRSVNAFSGVAGDVSYKADGGNVRPYGMKQIKDGKFTWIERPS